MSRWVTRATTLLGRKREPEPPVPFSVRCGCGNNVEGERQPRAQLARCNRCGDRLFVLPKDVYPRPKAPKPPPAPKPEPARRRAAPDPPETKAPEARPRRSMRGRISERAHALRERSGIRLRRAMQRQRAMFTPFRMLLLAIFGVVTLTVYWGWQARRADKAAATVQQATEVADAALSEGDFATAARLYEDAWRSLQILGRDDPEARRVGQAYRETTAASRLATISLYDLVESVKNSPVHANAGAGKAVPTEYEDFWIILECSLSAMRGTDGAPRTRIEYPLVIDGVPFVIETDGDVLDRFAAGEDVPRAIFAAQLQGVRFDPAQPGNSTVMLRGDTLFAWSNWETYQMLGLAGNGEKAEEASRRILAAQSEQIGVPQ